MSKTIHVFELEQSKIFLYACDASNKTDTEIILEAEIYHNYLKKYKPIKIIRKIKQTAVFGLDNYVKYYMIRYGYEHVRGGSYSNDILYDYQEQCLLKELETASENMPYSDAMNNILKKYANKTMSSTDILQEKKSVEIHFENYLKDKSHRDYLFLNFDISTFDGEKLLGDLEWLRKTCFKNVEVFENHQTKSFLFTINQKENIQKYKDLMEQLKKVYRVFSHLSESLGKSVQIKENPIFVKHPEFLFDDFFYHFSRVHKDSSIENVEKFCRDFTYFINTVINMTEELKFNFQSYDKDIEWTTPRILFLLDKMLEVSRKKVFH